MSAHAMRFRNRHHLIPRSRMGKSRFDPKRSTRLKQYFWKGAWKDEDDEENMLLINAGKHQLWHDLWGNRTVEEIHELLGRLIRAKKRR